MRRDSRPYIVKKTYLAFQAWYARHFLYPQFEHMGRGCTFMKPWHVEVFGGPVSLGDYATIIATSDRKVRLTVWSTFEGGGSISIGDYSLICPGVRISAARSITVGDSCMFAAGVFVTDADWHGIYDRGQAVGESSPVVIEDNVWIGDSAVVCKGVTIGENSIVGAGSVVVRDIPANVIAAGNPAAVVKSLDRGRAIKTRADLFVEPAALARAFDAIDRELMGKNTWWGWIRSMFFPGKGD